MLYICKPNRVSRTYLGGHRIDRMRGVDAQDGFFPEEWVASIVSTHNSVSSDTTEGLSILQDGKTLAELIDENPDLLGKYKKLPILLKLLDASERLVIQAHPTAEFAVEHLNSSFGKAECWYVISVDEGAHAYLGFKEGITREAWMDAFERQDVEKMLSMLHRFDLTEGDVLYVDGGVPHAIGGNCLLAELQEPTDLMVVTERVTPGGRVIAEDRLHCGLGFEKMFDVFNYTGHSKEELEKKYFRHSAVPENSGVEVIGTDLTDKFCMTEYSINGNMNIPLKNKPGIAVIISGKGILLDDEGEYPVKAGDGIFIPAYTKEIKALGTYNMLIATP